MDFTREPIIETIISAREGYKLSVKSSKQEEGYLVDTVEVVSLGGSLFYRCQERAKPFFFSTREYEICEVKEARLSVKSPVLEKSIKIGKGEESEGKLDSRKERRQRGRKKRPVSEEEVEKKEEIPSLSMFSHLLKPPEGLISEALQKYKREDLEASSEDLLITETYCDKQSLEVKKEEDPEFFSEPPKKDEVLEEVPSEIDVSAQGKGEGS